MNTPDNIKEPTNPTKVEGFCANCKSPISVPYPPIVPLMTSVVSGLSIPHPKGVECSKCGLYHAIIMVKASVDLGLTPAEKPKLNDEEPLVKPVTSLLDYKGKIPSV